MNGTKGDSAKQNKLEERQIPFICGKHEKTTTKKNRLTKLKQNLKSDYKIKFNKREG